MGLQGAIHTFRYGDTGSYILFMGLQGTTHFRIGVHGATDDCMSLGVTGSYTCFMALQGTTHFCIRAIGATHFCTGATESYRIFSMGATGSYSLWYGCSREPHSFVCGLHSFVLGVEV